MVLNIWSLSGVELLQFVAHNLCGFDPGLETGSRKAVKSNLVISLVPYKTIRMIAHIFVAFCSEKLNFNAYIFNFMRSCIFMKYLFNFFQSVVFK